LEHKQEKSLLMIRTNIGSVYNKINDFDHAIAYYEMAIEQAKKLNDPYILLAASSNLGTIYFAQKKLDEAIAIELPALEIAKSMGDVTSEISIMNNLASAYSSKGDYKNGLIYADGALNLLKTNKSASALLHATINKADILYHLGKGNEAFELLKQHMAIKDSLLQADQQASLTEMEEKYNSDKQEQKIKDLNTSKQIGDLKLKESEQASTIYLLIAISAGLLLALVVVALIINRNKNKVLESKNKIIEENLKEKEILLMEVHHRVKNNLQMIYSILNMQSKNLPADVADILNENKDRIRSISIVHEKLYRNEDISNININELITDIAENARKSSPFASNTQINVTCDNIKPDLDTMLSLGIMVNELVTNSFKYAFEQNKQNNIQISLRKKENMLFLKVNDNGRGFPVGFTPSASKSFGFKMLQTLCKKLKGQINCQNSNGAQIEITMERFALLN
jgi:two-component system, sensor histidine kinase PdtaS